MAKKTTRSTNGLVYSTNPDFKWNEEKQSDAITLLPGQQKLRIKLDTKHRAGKAVTLVEDFVGTDADIDELGKRLKAFCGTGGSIKDGRIIIQGDNKEKISQWLIKNGYIHTKKV